MRVVLDTNILVAAALSKWRNRWGRARWLVEIALAGQRRFAHVTSVPIIDELAEVLIRPRMVDRAFAEAFIETLLSDSTVVRVHGVPMGCRDPDDDKVLETAVIGHAGAIVSDDRDLRDLGARSAFDSCALRPTTVWTLDEFVAELHAGPLFSPLIAPELLPATLAA